jgi:indoleamine 2,3-dioxygenase
MRRTKHPVAPGGTPIVTWLPNQLSCVLKRMREVGSRIDQSKLSPPSMELYRTICMHTQTQEAYLQREVEKLKWRYKNKACM